MDARTAILTRARDAIARSQRGPARPVPRDYIRVGEHAPGSEPVVADMVDKLEDYDAVVRTEPDDAGLFHVPHQHFLFLAWARRSRRADVNTLGRSRPQDIPHRHSGTDAGRRIRQARRFPPQRLS